MIGFNQNVDIWYEFLYQLTFKLLFGPTLKRFLVFYSIQKCVQNIYALKIEILKSDGRPAHIEIKKKFKTYSDDKKL